MYAFKSEFMGFSEPLEQYGGIKNISLYDDEVFSLQLKALKKLGAPVLSSRIPTHPILTFLREHVQSFKSKLEKTISSTRQRVSDILKEMNIEISFLKKTATSREADKTLEDNLESFKGATGSSSKLTDVDSLAIRMSNLFWEFNALMESLSERIRSGTQHVNIVRDDLQSDHTCLASTLFIKLLADANAISRKIQANTTGSNFIRDVLTLETLLRQALTLPVFLSDGKGRDVISINDLRSELQSAGLYKDGNICTSKSFNSINDTLKHRASVARQVIQTVCRYKVRRDEFRATDDGDCYVPPEHTRFNRLVCIAHETSFKRRMDLDAQMIIARSVLKGFLTSDVGVDDSKLVPGSTKSMVDQFIETVESELRGTLEKSSEKAAPILHYIVPMSSIRLGNFHKPHRFPASDCLLSMKCMDTSSGNNSSRSSSRSHSDAFSAEGNIVACKARVELTGGSLRLHFTRGSPALLNPVESREILLSDILKITQEGNYFTVFFDDRQAVCDSSDSADLETVAKNHASKAFRRYVHSSDPDVIVRGFKSVNDATLIELDPISQSNGNDDATETSSMDSDETNEDATASGKDLFQFALKYNENDGAFFQFQIVEDEIRELFDLVVKEAELQFPSRVIGFEGETVPHPRADCVIRQGEGVQHFTLPIDEFGVAKTSGIDAEDDIATSGTAIQHDFSYKDGRLRLATYEGMSADHRFDGEGVYTGVVPPELSTVKNLDGMMVGRYVGGFSKGMRHGDGEFTFSRPLPVLLDSPFATVTIKGSFVRDMLHDLNSCETSESGRVLTKWREQFEKAMPAILKHCRRHPHGVFGDNLEFRKLAEIATFSMFTNRALDLDVAEVGEEWNIDLSRSKIFNPVNGLQLDIADNTDDHWSRAEFIPHLTRWADSRVNPLPRILTRGLLDESEVDGSTIVSPDSNNVLARQLQYADEEAMKLETLTVQMTGEKICYTVGNLRPFDETAEVVQRRSLSDNIKYVDVNSATSPITFVGKATNGIFEEGILHVGTAIYQGPLNNFSPDNVDIGLGESESKLVIINDMYEFLDVEGNGALENSNRALQRCTASSFDSTPKFFFNMANIDPENFVIGTIISDATTVVIDSQASGDEDVSVDDFHMEGKFRVFVSASRNNSVSLKGLIDEACRRAQNSNSQEFSFDVVLRDGAILLDEDQYVRICNVEKRLFTERKASILKLLDAGRKGVGPLCYMENEKLDAVFAAVSSAFEPKAYDELKRLANQLPSVCWKVSRDVSDDKLEVLRESVKLRKSDALRKLLSAAGFDTVAPRLHGRRAPLGALTADVIIGGIEAYQEYKLNEQTAAQEQQVSGLLEFNCFASVDDSSTRFTCLTPSGAAPVLYASQAAVERSGRDFGGFVDLYAVAYPKSVIERMCDKKEKSTDDLLLPVKQQDRSERDTISEVSQITEKAVLLFSGCVENGEAVFAESFKYFHTPTQNSHRVLLEDMLKQRQDFICAAPQIEAFDVTYTGQIHKSLPNGVGVWRTGNCIHYFGNFSSGLPDGEGALFDPVTQLPIFEGRFSMGSPQYGKVYVLCPVTKMAIGKNLNTAVEGIPDVVDRHFCYEGPVDSSGRPHTIVDNLESAEIWRHAMNPVDDNMPVHKSLGRGLYVRDQTWESSFGLSFGSSGSDTAVYVGEYRDGLRHGRGKLLMSGICVYQGTWSYDMPDNQENDVLVSGFTQIVQKAMESGSPIPSNDATKLVNSLQAANISWIAWRWAGLNGQAASLDIPVLVRDMLSSISLDQISVPYLHYPSISVDETLKGRVSQLIDITALRAWSKAAQYGYGSQVRMEMLANAANDFVERTIEQL
eukprot:GDKK01071404.1.p1 GENE.GDKK01071404.1~~GDKK01071404.1.p1  ORF type:complete len:1836 (-),score=413.89 GDKK01071404.1:66-5534(-)